MRQVAEFFAGKLPRQLVDYVGLDEEGRNKLRALSSRRPAKVLEVGTGLGISTAVAALSHLENEIVTVDLNLPICVFGKQLGVATDRPILGFANEFFRHLGISDRVRILEGYFSVETNGYVLRYTDEWGGKADPWLARSAEVVGPRAAEHGPFDIAIVDGDHSAGAVYSDLVLASSLLTDEATIIVDDIHHPKWGNGVHAAIGEFADAVRDWRGCRVDADVSGNVAVIRWRRTSGGPRGPYPPTDTIYR